MKSIHFEYVVQANDNHAGIDIASISLKTDILDLAGNQMNDIFDADLLSKNKQISFINFDDITLSLQNSNGPLNELQAFNDNSLALTVSGTNKFRYKVVSNPAACDIDSSYLQSSSNPMTLTFSSSSNELVVICVSPVLDNGFEKPIEEGIEDFIVIRKITPPPAVVINLPPRTDQSTVNAEIVFSFKGSYRHQFKPLSQVDECNDESMYGGKEVNSRQQHTDLYL